MKIETKSASKNYKLRNADFELGSAQFDIPQMNFRDDESSVPTPQLMRSALKKREIMNASPSPMKLQNAGDVSARKGMKLTLDSAKVDTDGALFEDESVPGSSNVLRVLTKYVTQKHCNDVSLAVLIEQKKLKENIFKNIFEQFT